MEREIMMTNRTMILVGTTAALGLMLVASAFTAVGIFVGTRWVASPSPITVHADTAAGGEGLSFATGPITGEVEGLFVMDHQTGVLQCWVVNQNTGNIGALYKFNVAAELGVEKAGDADYVIATGKIDFIGNARVGNDTPSRCICYVGDGNTGRVIGLGLYINKSILAAREQQEGEMTVICRGFTREGSRLRDQ